MSIPNEPSLTGSESGAPPTHTASVSIALGRLRSSVVLCCWIAVIALVVQGVVWALISFTDLRWTTITAGGAAPLVVVEQGGEEETISSPLDARADHDPQAEGVDPNHVLGKNDQIFAVTAALAQGFGSLAVLAMVPLVGLGVLLAASSATAGVERTVSAFGWSLIVALLAMPIAGLVGLPWQDGGLWSYTRLTAEIDAGAEVAAGAGALVFYARYLLLPAACLLAVALAGSRFGVGVEAGLFRKEVLTLDPTLEREAANIKPESLHGGRAATAMRQAVADLKQSQLSAAPGAPSAGPPSRTEVPKRLI